MVTTTSTSPARARGYSARPRALDLCCGGGGSSYGLWLAGFDVTGVDLVHHPSYPFRFVQADAMDVLDDVEYLRQFHLVLAGPPCQGYSTITPDSARGNHPRLIGPMREKLRANFGPGLYVIENVEGARDDMEGPIRLCGSSLGLQVRRHRLFESNAALMTPGCHHGGRLAYGVYGKHPEVTEYRRPTGTRRRRGRRAHSVEHAQQLLGIHWLNDWHDLTDAIPPAYTQMLGEQIITQL